MRTVTFVCLLLSLAVPALLWWVNSLAGEAPTPGGVCEAEPGVARTAIPDGASVQVLPAGDDREGILRTVGDVSTLPYGPPEIPFALIGRVVDQRGDPIPNAVVTGSPGPWYDVIKPTIFDKEFTKEVRERVRGVLRLRTFGVTDADGRFRIGAAGLSEQIEFRVQARSEEHTSELQSPC